MLSRFLTEENHIIPSKICVRKENERNLQALKRRIHVPTPLFTTELCQLWKLFNFGLGFMTLKFLPNTINKVVVWLSVLVVLSMVVLLSSETKKQRFLLKSINNLCRGVVVQNWPMQNYFYRWKVCLQQTTNIQQIKYYAPSIFQQFVKDD